MRSAPKQAKTALTEKDEKRFWSKVALPNGEGCMLWMASKYPSGYGAFSLNGKMRYAHRIAYELAYGLIPDGLQTDHLCRVRHCVAPLHLEAVTQAENIRRGEVGCHQRARTECLNGHSFTELNTYYRTDGGRGCRICRRKQNRQAKQRRRDARRAQAG